jgi:hypothetical protein
MNIMMHFEYEGKTVLGFDTGLNERAFAQAKANSLVTELGYVVSQDCSINIWKPEGVTEINKRMIIWGSHFDGTSLNALIQNDADKDATLNAMRSWLRAIKVLSEKNIFPNTSPIGAIIAEDGRIFFPPSTLTKRCLDAKGKETVLSASLRYQHPDLTENDALIFSAGTMFYQIFSGEAAFHHSNSETVRSDMRQGNFLPINLAAFGLKQNIVQLINDALKPENAKPSLTHFIELIEQEKLFTDFFMQIGDDEKKLLMTKQKQYQKRNEIKIKTKMFFHQKKSILIGTGIGIAIIIFIAWNIIAGIQNKPGTKGMTPYEIAERYYESFGIMDHDFMEAATINNAGKNDIAMVQNLFVISKVRQAYEMTAPVIPVQVWIDEGSPKTESIIFGVSNLELKETNQSDQEIIFAAKYYLWMPANFISSDEDMQSAESTDSQTSLPISVEHNSTIKLIKKNDVWHIAEITEQ